jgi:3',5'-cyclic AMP phosphodiesterase CpdA
MGRDFMKNKPACLITRRQAIKSLAALTAGAIVRPTSVFSADPIKNKLRFVVLGDWGTGEDDQYGLGRRMVEQHRQLALDFVLAAGDNIYPNGSGRHFVKKFEQPFADLIKDRVPFYAALGNHDVEEGRQDQLNYSLFNMGGNNYYTVSRGNGLADFFLLDTTALDNTQLNWLENSLRNSRAKWKIAITHHPLYSSGKKHGSSPKIQQKLEPLFTHYGIQVVFSGHDHIYERTHPQKGIQYFVTGAGGKTRRGGVDLKSQCRAVSFDEDNHFMVIELDDREINFKAICEQGGVRDSGTIKQAS